MRFTALLLLVVVILTGCQSNHAALPLRKLPDPKETPAGVTFSLHGSQFMDGVLGQMKLDDEGFYHVRFILRKDFDLRRYTKADSADISVRIVFTSRSTSPMAELTFPLRALTPAPDQAADAIILERRLQKLDECYRSFLCNYSWVENTL
jgi:hypothetical protein